MGFRTVDDVWELVASGAQTATSTGTTPVRNAGGYAAMLFVLDVTAAATDVGDTLDVFVQTMLPNGSWVDVVAFTQVLGNGGAKRYVAKVDATLAQAMFESSATLSAGSVRNILGNDYRARWAITDAGTDNASFTFSITGMGLAT